MDWHDGRDTVCVLNPASGSGRTARLSREISDLVRARLSPDASILVTRSPNDAFRWTSSCERMGRVRTLVIVGGDGTVQECVNGLMALPPDVRNRISVGLISRGTGEGFAQSLGLPRSLGSQVEVISAGTFVSVDLGLISCLSGDGRPMVRYFVNEAQLGIGAEVVRRVEHRTKRFGGMLTYGFRAFDAAWTQPDQRADISFDGMRPSEHVLFGVTIANGAFTGGGMNIAPGASVRDGQLDCLLMLQSHPFRRVVGLSQVYSGRHIRSNRFPLRPIRTVSISSPHSFAVAADGEFLGTTPLSCTVVPSALMFFIPESLS